MDEVVTHPVRFMVYLGEPTNEYLPIVETSMSGDGTVDVRVDGVDRWANVSEGTVHQLHHGLIGKPWDESLFGTCPYHTGRPRRDTGIVTSDEFDHLRNLVDVTGSPEMLVRNLGRTDVNVRKWVLEVFGVDVMTTDRATVQVTRFGLRVIGNRLDTMVREGLQFAPSAGDLGKGTHESTEELLVVSFYHRGNFFPNCERISLVVDN